MSEVAFLTDVRRGRADDLRDYLRLLGARRPFAVAPLRTHFARFVVLDLDRPRMLFTSRFDGEEKAYLEGLAGTEEAQVIWSHCARPYLADEQSLRHYLLKDKGARVPPSYVVSAVPGETSVNDVNDALALRGRLKLLAAELRGLDAADLAQAFRENADVRWLSES